jgi:hypothetical protein
MATSEYWSDRQWPASVAPRNAKSYGPESTEITLSLNDSKPEDQLRGWFGSMRLTNCTLKLKKDTRLQIVNPIPHKIRSPPVTRCSVEGSAFGHLGAPFRVHLKIIRLSGPPALK